jgi:hypothetical protein
VCKVRNTSRIFPARKHIKDGEYIVNGRDPVETVGLIGTVTEEDGAKIIDVTSVVEVN